MSNTYNLECFCKGVTFSYNGDLSDSITCYCDDCRLSNGTLLAWNCPVKESQVTFHSGKELLSEFSRNQVKYRVFCKRCGSPVFSYRKDKPGLVRLRLGLITNSKDLSDVPPPSKVLYPDYKPSWFHADISSQNHNN